MAEAFTVDELQVLITASAKEFSSQMNQVKAQISSLAKSAEKTTPRISSAAVAAGNIISKVLVSAFRSVTSAMGDAVSRLDTLNNFPRVMSNLGIGATESQKAINFLSEKLQGLPTTIDAAALSVQRFTSANGNIQASTGMFLALNNAILAGGASAEIQASALEQVSQAYAKGKPDMMEWRTMMMAMPAQLKQVAQAMGYASSNDLGEALRDGTISMNDFMATVVKLNKNGANGFASFEDQARNSTGGVQTSIINMKTALVRGLQQIMDAIGQSNIAGFFNTVASAIGTAANYVVAFIRIVLTAINALRALFGQSALAFGKTTTSADSAADAVSGIGASANDATDAIGGTGKAAKKLQKQLAGFDEMNVLKEQDTSSGSGGGGGSAGASGLGDLSGLLDFGELDTGVDKVEEIVNRIRDKLNGMFDFNVIGASIKQFVDDLSAGFAPIGEIISDIWNDYLKPLVSWTGNELLPSFLNALGGGIRFVGEMIGAFWDVALKPFIDTFVVPIAQFAGSIITTTLDTIGNALRTLAENEAGIRTVATAITGIGLAIATWKAGDIALFIANMTKIKSVQNIVLNLGSAIEKANKKLSELIKNGFNKIKNAVKNPISSIKEFNTHLGSNLSSAWSKAKTAFSGVIDGFKNIVTHGGTTTNFLKGTALSAFDGLKTAVGGLKTGITNLWNAFLANPLGVIVGLFSLLMSTNEEFRESVMNLVKAALQPLADIFSKVMSLLQPIIDLVVNLLSLALKPLQGILEALAPVITTLLSVAIIPLQVALEAVGWVIENVVKPAIDAISGAFSWLGSLFGINTEKTNENTDAIKNNAETANGATGPLAEYKDQIDRNKDGEISYSEAIDWVNSLLLARADKEIAVITAEENRQKKTEELAEACRKYGLTIEEANALVDEGTNSHNLNGDAVNEVTKAVWESRKADLQLKQSKSDLNAQIEENNQKIEKSKKQYQDAATELGKLSLSTNSTTAQFEEQKKKLNEAKASLDGFGISTKDLANDKLNMLKNSYSSAITKLQALSDGTKHSKEDFERQKEATKNVADAITALGGTITPLKSYQDIIYNQGKVTMERGQQGFQQNKGKLDNYLQSAGSSSGGYWGSGIINKIDGMQTQFYNSGARAANAQNRGYRDTNQIKSPSKVAKKLSGFWAEGIIIGMEDKMNEVEDASRQIAEAANTSFEDMLDPSTASFNKAVDKMNGELETTLAEVIEANAQTHVTVKVGEDTLVDKIVEGVNNSSFLANRSILNV